MKEPKVIQYHHLVSAAKQILLTIKLDKPTTYDEEGDKIIVGSCTSGMYLYGGYAPRDLKLLLTYHHMHKIRKEWADRVLFKYFKLFFPKLTKKRMWEIITERRQHFRPDFRKVQQRQELSHREQDLKVKVKHPYKPDNVIIDNYPRIESKNYDRLFPLANINYVKFILDKCRDKDVDKEIYSNIISGKREDVRKYYDKDKSEIHTWSVATNEMQYPWGIDFKLLIIPGKLIFLEKPNRTRAIDRQYYKPIEQTLSVDDENYIDDTY